MNEESTFMIFMRNNRAGTYFLALLCRETIFAFVRQSMDVFSASSGGTNISSSAGCGPGRSEALCALSGFAGDLQCVLFCF